MLDRNDIETRAYESINDRNEREWELKLAIFREDPYSHAEWNQSAFSLTDLLDVALEHILQDFDMDAAVAHRASQCSRKGILDALRDTVLKVEI